ncbi:MAG: GNAT family N-acetyltransferase [Bacteroidia bacterium]|nr:GNAT family N-acetyltransferase [Bacteroidia bacterium]
MDLNPAKLSLRRCGSADAAMLSAFSRATFAQAFASQNDPEALEAYMSRAFAPVQLLGELEDPAVLFFCWEDAAGAPAGYAKLARSSGSQMELSRFYTERSWQGSGLAQQMMAHCLHTARSAGCSRIWLGVWQENPRAIRFYEKCGFRITGVMTFLMGAEAQQDWKMEREL